MPVLRLSRLSAVRSVDKLAATTKSTAVKVVADTDKVFAAVLPTAVEVTALESAVIVRFSTSVRSIPSAIATEAKLVPEIDDKTPPFRVCSPTTATEAVRSLAETAKACVAVLAFAVEVTALLDMSNAAFDKSVPSVSVPVVEPALPTVRPIVSPTVSAMTDSAT